MRKNESFCTKAEDAGSRALVAFSIAGSWAAVIIFAGACLLTVLMFEGWHNALFRMMVSAFGIPPTMHTTWIAFKCVLLIAGLEFYHQFRHYFPLSRKEVNREWQRRRKRRARLATPA